MFMHKAFVELSTENRQLRESNLNLEKRNAKLENDLASALKSCKEERELDTRKNALLIEEKLNTLRKEMQKSLTESDLKRVEAIAKLETYEKMDTKTERDAIRNMLEKAIAGLSARPIISK